MVCIRCVMNENVEVTHSDAGSTGDLQLQLPVQLSPEAGLQIGKSGKRLITPSLGDMHKVILGQL